MPEPTENAVYIPQSNMIRLDNEIEKLNRRADKIGCPRVEYYVHDVVTVPDPTTASNMKNYLRRELTEEELSGIKMVDLCLIEIVGKGPKVDGYRFVGTLDHYTIPGSVIVNTVPGETVPAQFFESDAICNHCNAKRNRIETFIVEKEDDNTYLQIGRNCLRDFFGHDPQYIARFLTRVMNLVKNLKEDDEWRGTSERTTYYYNSVKVLTNTVAAIRSFGWVPKSAASEERAATSSEVGYMMSSPCNTLARQALDRYLQRVQFNLEEDLKEAEAAIEWLKVQEGNNEYMHNLKLLEDADAIPSKMFGYWCSLIAAYQRVQARLEKAKKENRLNEHLGEIKDRVEVVVKCTKLRYIDGYYGTVCIHNMRDSEGRTIIWFANADAKMKKGNSYSIRATIKKHDEYRNWKQTHVSRLTVIEEVKNDS